MTDQQNPVPPTPSGVPAPPPDSENPAIIFAKKTYFWLVIFAVAFIGAVVVFIL